VLTFLSEVWTGTVVLSGNLIWNSLVEVSWHQCDTLLNWYWQIEFSNYYVLSIKLFIWIDIFTTFELAPQEILFLLRSNHLLVLAYLFGIVNYFCCGILSSCESSAPVDWFWNLIFCTNWDVHDVVKVSHRTFKSIKTRSHFKFQVQISLQWYKKQNQFITIPFTRGLQSLKLFEVYESLQQSYLTISYKAIQATSIYPTDREFTGSRSAGF